MFLYKYAGPEGVTILQDRSIWLADPGSYDDPFETGSGAVVLSLSARRDSVPMWRHYAAAHTGLAIGFDAMQGILAGEFQHEYRLAPVVYTAMRPFPASDGDARPLLTKSDDWEHEDEWRIVDMNLRTCAEAIDPPQRAHWRCAIRPGSVQEVIVGCRATNAVREAIVAVLGHPDFRHVSLFRAVADEQRFCLNLVEQPREVPGP
jgi:hypothetical protein